MISVLLVPVLQSSQDSEGGADASLYLPGQRVPAWAEEPLANPLPHRSGFSVFISDPDKAASGEAVWLWSVRMASHDEWILGFPPRAICVSLFVVNFTSSLFFLSLFLKNDVKLY